MAGSAADGAAAPSCLFAVRLVDIDVDLARASELDLRASPLTGRPLRTVPVIRIFGSTPRGQKVLLHVHAVGLAAAARGEGESIRDLCSAAFAQVSLSNISIL